MQVWGVWRECGPKKEKVSEGGYSCDGSWKALFELLLTIWSTTSERGLVPLLTMAVQRSTPSGGSGPVSSADAPARAAIVVYQSAACAAPLQTPPRAD